MKSFICACALLLLVICSSQSEAGRCTRAIRQCNVTNDVTGSWSFENYDNCLFECCGGRLSARDVQLECCGTQQSGTIYNQTSEICCSWYNGGQFEVYNNTQGAMCCGSQVFYQTRTDRLSCCAGWPGAPQVFNPLTEMCCAGVVQFAGNTAYTSCCGPTSFDRRIASCPCNNGGIVLAPAQFGACCGDGREVAAYDTRTQECCNGKVYDTQTQGCCDGKVYNFTSQLCCGKVLVDSNVTVAEDTACCISFSGQYVQYDPKTQVCCDGVLRTGNANSMCCGMDVHDPAVDGESCCGLEAYFRTKKLCCGGEAYTMSISGDACCNDQEPFFSDGSVCCNERVMDGDSCCGGVPFYKMGHICCDGTITTHNFTWPACCVNTPFDAYTQTCCDVTVYPNPVITGAGGITTVSHHTRCCGNYLNPSTLGPYDYDTQTCCDGAIVELVGIPAEYAQCCGASVIDANNFECCGGIPMQISPADACCADVIIDAARFICCDGTGATLAGSNTKCCGSASMDGDQFICCDGVPAQLGNITIDQAVCCGSTTMNSDLSLCCNGVPRSLNGIAKENAICCGDGCIDGSTFYCCDGKQYQKGVGFGEFVSGRTCGQFFP